jgi:hypothetical protein
MKKMIRSTKDNKAFFNLTKPVICDFLISLGGHNMRKMHAKKHLIIKRMRVSKYGILA